MSFAELIKEYRTNSGLSASKFGRMIGIEGATIYKWEHGHGLPSASALKAIVDVFGLDPVTLIDSLPSSNTDPDGLAA